MSVLLGVNIDHVATLRQARRGASPSVTEAAQAALRDVDVLARWGGEEFMVMLPDTRLTAARLGLERLRTRVEALRVAHDGAELAFTLSAGVVEYSPAEPLVEAIARADRALYQAKQQGRNKVVAG